MSCDSQCVVEGLPHDGGPDRAGRVSALDRLAKLPGWPARMTAPVAAAYMGVSQSTFLTRFGAIGVKEGANTFWAKIQLDLIVADQFGLRGMAELDHARCSVENAYDRWKAKRAGDWRQDQPGLASNPSRARSPDPVTRKST